MVKNLRLLRTEKGLSQQQLADVIGMTQQSINKYENHKVEPDIYTLSLLADFFETSIDYLVGRTDVRHAVEEVWRCDLNADELELVEKYRQLSRNKRETVQSVVKSFLE